VRAGAVAAGGSLLGLAAAILVGHMLDSLRVSFRVWAACTVAAVVAGVLRHAETPWSVPPIALRLLGAAPVGLVLGGGTFALAVGWLDLPKHGPLPVAFYGASGLVLLLAGLRRPSAAFALDDVPDDGPGGLLPAAPPVERGAPSALYALAKNGPEVKADECERGAPAVEVRMFWGTDVLRVVHLDPPRPFAIGDGPLVVARASGVRAVASRGSAGVVRVASGALLTIDQALAEGIAEPSGDGAEIRLAEGTTVTLSPSARGACAYRSGPEAAACVAFEVSLVRAGKRVRRAPLLAGARRFAVITLLGASAVGGAIAWASRTGAPPDHEVEQVGSDQRYLMQQYLHAAAEQEMEEEDEQTPITWSRDSEDGLTGLEGRPFDQPAEADIMGPGFACGVLGERSAGGAPAPFPDLRTRYCDTPVVTPFGLRGLGAAPPYDLLWRNARDPWPLDYERARRRLGLGAASGWAASGSRPRRLDPFTSVSVRDTDSHGSVHVRPPLRDTLMRGFMRDLKACWALGLAENPHLWGYAVLLVVVGRDGVMHFRWSTGSLHDARVEACFRGALDGLALPPPERVEVGFYVVNPAEAWEH
jgi:hypothetical protein